MLPALLLRGAPAAAAAAEPVAAAAASGGGRLARQQLRRLSGTREEKDEPKASPWIKVLQRPGADPDHFSEGAPVVVEGQRAESPDVSADVPEKNPGTQPQAPVDPEVLAAAEANKSTDSVRHIAGKLNEAVGGSYDFPNTGGASVRDMASEIGDNVAGLLGMDRRADGVAGTADKVAGKIVDGANKAADTAKSALDSAKDTAKQG